MPNKQLLVECKQKLLEAFTTEAIADIKQGNVRIMKFKKKHLFHMTSAVAVTTGMYIHRLPEIIIFYGPLNDKPEILSGETILTIEKDIDAVVNSIIDKGEIPPLGTYCTGLSTNIFARMNDTDFKMSEAFILEHLFATAALLNTDEVLISTLVRLPSGDSSNQIIH